MTASKTLCPMKVSYAVVGLPLLALAAFNAYLGLYVAARFMDMIWGVVGPLVASVIWMAIPTGSAGLGVPRADRLHRRGRWCRFDVLLLMRATGEHHYRNQERDRTLHAVA